MIEWFSRTLPEQAGVSTWVDIAGFFTRASALTVLLVFALTLFALPDGSVLAHIGPFSLASTLSITGAGPDALESDQHGQSR